jgi:hypothetical protein
VKVVGEQLVLPRNFEFFRRLPARFQILVIGKGAVRPEGTTFEIEIMGQRLTLRSKIELKPGNRYELEKKSVTEFRIAREIEKDSPGESFSATVTTKKLADIENVPSFAMRFDGVSVSPHDLLQVRDLEESDAVIETVGKKFRFDLETSVGLKGLFVPRSDASFALIVTGVSTNEENLEQFRALVADLKITSVARVDATTFEHISSGAIDFSR